MAVVTFAMASFNSGPLLDAAIGSALAQRGVDVEVIVVDDQSSDDSFARACGWAARDPRVRAFCAPVKGGPAGARNLALAEARGRWLAVLDSDDLIHPDRTRRLLAEAGRSGADMIADDLIVFPHDGRAPPALFLSPRRARAPRWIGLEDYFTETVLYGRHPNLGFLKPMVETAFLRRHGIAYDERLRIAEDDDLAIRLLRAGARYRLLPEPLYFYRKHGQSISHRLSQDHVDRMVAAADRLRASLAGEPALLAALGPRDRSVRRTQAFTRAIGALGARRPLAALAVAAANPGMLPLFRMPLAGLVRKLRGSPALPEAAPSSDPRSVLFISRQRLIGATNGSSAYLLALAEAVRGHGLVPHLLQPSPTLFGRMPVFRLRPEMAVFETHRVRGAVRIGPWLAARDPRLYAAAAGGVIGRLARRAGFRGGWTADRPAPYAIATPWTREDRLFVAAHGRGHRGFAVADYVFQTEAFPYLLDAPRRTATVMHDMFSARAGQFGAAGEADSVAALDRATEFDLLARADAVIAIQAAEAEAVRAALPDRAVLTVPMPARPVAEAQPGDPARLLFVGSNTAPNVHGLRWFVDEIWPIVSAAAPALRLDVAGSVAAGVPAPPPGVTLLGLVDDLGPLYAAAGVVISPLRQGSGLKIKLVEALARGKAAVVTGVTLQGVEDLAGEAVVRADAAPDFAAAILRLIGDEDARRTLAEAALAAARTRFGPEACYRALGAWLSGTAADEGAGTSRQARI